MTTISAPRTRSTPHLTDDAVTHGAHVPCQTGLPYVTAICGSHLAWDDEAGNSTGMCVVCLDLLTCPICGATLKMPS